MNISSQSVYDPERQKPATETDTPVLRDVYSTGKYCVELLLNNICANIPHTNIRLASLIGPGFDVRMPNKMCASALEKHTITVARNEDRYGYLDVQDAAFAICELAKKPPCSWQTVYNLGINGSYTTEDIGRTIARVLKSEYNFSTNLVFSESDSHNNSELCNDLLVKDIGEYSKTSLQESIRRILEFMRPRIGSSGSAGVK